MEEVTKYRCTKEEYEEILKMHKEGCDHRESCSGCILIPYCDLLDDTSPKKAAKIVLDNIIF